MELVRASMPIIYTSAGVATALLAIIGCFYRLESIKYFLKHTLLHRPQFNYYEIFRNYLDPLKTTENCRALYTEILSITCRILSSNGASLIIREESGSFRIVASQGLASFSFNPDEIKGFFSWIEKHRLVVTREQLVNSKMHRDIKSEGLKYCVQSNAEACTPLFLDNKLYGILNVGNRKRGGYDREACDILHSLAIYFTSLIKASELKEELMRKDLALKQTTQFRNHLLSNLSHEFRTPLNSIIGLAEALESGTDGQLTEDQHTHAKMIHESGKRLLNTLNSIIDLSKAEANHLELNVQKINLRRLLGNVAESIPFNKDTHFALGIGEDNSSVYGDENRLKQVFWHLLSNAAKFTQRGKISVATSKCGEMIKVCIADTGIGIAGDDKEKIFSGFYQVDNGATKNHDGLGLGLAMSQKIVKLHGGRLWFASKPGQGSNFYLTLPIKPIGIKHPEISLS